MFPGMKNGYVLYRVDTHDPDGGQGRSVRRRFRDFVVRPGNIHACSTMLRGVVYHACSSGLTLTHACIDPTAEPGRHAEGVTPGLLPAATPREAAQPARGTGVVWCGAALDLVRSFHTTHSICFLSSTHLATCDRCPTRNLWHHAVLRWRSGCDGCRRTLSSGTAR
jgi:hypothetical protein